MVMEDKHHLSPAGDHNANNTNNNVYLVGLEFVRQYYTVLNQGPLYLHRFYSDDSSFVHGTSARDSKVAYGQQEIHKRIQSLNFHNCHAKIRQVDSHETLGNGVVIQVTGELSNNGQPMRRFMQTFVLAPQNPKRYYVRNDIFHYQDEIFCDDDGEPETPPESTPVDTEEVEDIDKEGDINGGSEIVTADPTSPVSTTVTVPKLSPGSGMAPPTVSASVTSPSTLVEMSSVEEKVQGKPVLDPPALSSNQQSGAGDEDLPTAVKPSAGAPPVAEEEQPPVSTNNGPKTYANLFKSNSSSLSSKPTKLATDFKPPVATGKSGAGSNGPAGGSPGNSQVTVSVNEAGITSPPQVSPLPSSTGVNKNLPPRNPQRNQPYNRDRGVERDRPGNERDGYPNRRDGRERLISRSSTNLNDDTGSVDGDRRRPVNTYPDANQLFVGNLPHYTTVQDMKDIFSVFGEVAEVKIQKPTPKNSGMKVPYFCFVVFEDAASAQLAIEKKADICMKISNGQSRRLNVEPKRSQRSGRSGQDESDAPYNRMDAASPAGNRTSDSMRPQGRSFRGSSSRDGPRMSGDRDRGGNTGRGGMSERGGVGRGGLGRDGGGRGN